MRQVNPLVEGSSPSPVIGEKGRKNPSGPEIYRARVKSRSNPSLRQYPNESGSIRPSTATQNATRLLPDDPDLAAVVEAWPDLPEAIKAGIMALVQTSWRKA